MFHWTCWTCCNWRAWVWHIHLKQPSLNLTVHPQKMHAFPKSDPVSQNDMFVSRSVFQSKGPVGTNLGGWDLCWKKPPPLASSRHSGGFSRVAPGVRPRPDVGLSLRIVIWKTISLSQVFLLENAHTHIYKYTMWRPSFARVERYIFQFLVGSIFFVKSWPESSWYCSIDIRQTP